MWEGPLYVMTVFDTHSRRVIGWAIDERMRSDLVKDAPAHSNYATGRTTREGHFSYRYGHATHLGTEHRVRQRERAHPFDGLHRVCWDNGIAEPFFATLKTEFFYRHVWPTKRGARIAVGNWIEDCYNRRRRHPSLGPRRSARLTALASAMTPSRARPNPRSSTSTAAANST